MKGDMAVQGLPALGVVSWASYLAGSTGGNVIVMSRPAARKLATPGGRRRPRDGGRRARLEAPSSPMIAGAAQRLIDTAVGDDRGTARRAAGLSDRRSRARSTPRARRFVGIDLAPRATAVTYTFAGRDDQVRPPDPERAS